MWQPQEVARQITGGAVAACLPGGDRATLAALTATDLAAAVGAALQRPQPSDMSLGRRVLSAVLAAQYAEAFAVLGLPQELSVYEPCVGASDPVIVAAEAYSGGRARYTAVNLNRKLRAELDGKVAHLRSSIRVIDDDAARALQHLAPRSVDVACFHHAINDILQTAVSEARGLDTATVDWWPQERRMIEWLAEDAAAGQLATRGQPELLRVVGDAVALVRPGGWLVFDHWTWLGHGREAWFPWELFCDLIPMTRRWIAAASLPVTEVRLDGADPRWWMFLRVERNP